MEDKDLFILHGQYHGCWWSTEGRSRGINSHGIDLFLQGELTWIDFTLSMDE